MNGATEMNQTVSLTGSFVLLLCVLGSVVYLAHDHIITGGAAVGIISSIISLAGGALAVHTGVKAGAEAALSPPVEKAVKTK